MRDRIESIVASLFRETRDGRFEVPGGRKGDLGGRGIGAGRVEDERGTGEGGRGGGVGDEEEVSWKTGTVDSSDVVRLRVLGGIGI